MKSGAIQKRLVIKTIKQLIHEKQSGMRFSEYIRRLSYGGKTYRFSRLVMVNL